MKNPLFQLVNCLGQSSLLGGFRRRVLIEYVELDEETLTLKKQNDHIKLV